MSPSLAESRQVRDDIGALTERVADLVGADHPAVSSLIRAADELTVTALETGPRRYGGR